MAECITLNERKERYEYIQCLKGGAKTFFIGCIRVRRKGPPI